MSLENIGGGSVPGSAFASPNQLARILEQDGTDAQNANILNLFLNNATFTGGAPEPITANVGRQQIDASFVFQNNFSRQRFGRAAVNSNIGLQSDRISLLLNNNQTSTEKARSVISSLSVSNGLSAVQSMSNTQVTNLTQPDLDKFDNYPEQLFNNAVQLNSTKETYVFDAIAASEDATTALAGFTA